MMAEHTPGPWVAETVRTTCGLCHKIGPFPSPKSWRSDKPAHACIYDDYQPDGGSSELVANARLIAAAPDMLEALITALPYIEAAEEDEAYKPGAVRKVTNLIRAALSRATSEQPDTSTEPRP